MTVRLMRANEVSEVRSMMRDLWPDAGEYDSSDELVSVWEGPDRVSGGFASFSLRPWAEGCHSTPVPYVEGWWVAPELRGQGVGRKLFEPIERLCREHGYAARAARAAP